MLEHVDVVQCKDDEPERHDIKLVEAREDSAETFGPAQRSLDIVALLVHLPVVVPELESVTLWRHHRPKGPKTAAGSRVVIRGSRTKLGIPVPRDLPMHWDVLFEAPALSGCTLMLLVLSRLKVSTLVRIICFHYEYANTRLRMPLFDRY